METDMSRWPNTLPTGVERQLGSICYLQTASVFGIAAEKL